MFRIETINFDTRLRLERNSPLMEQLNPKAVDLNSRMEQFRRRLQLEAHLVHIQQFNPQAQAQKSISTAYRRL